MSDLVRCMRAYRSALADFNPALWSGDDCRALAEELATTTKASAAAAAAAAARAASCGAHRRQGFHDAADWLARTGGTTRSEAKDAMAVAESAAQCPATAKALADGKLSLPQAKEITRAEAEAPGSEEELLALAETADLQTLRHESRRMRLEATDADDLRRRQHAARELRHWRDDLGMVRITAGLPPEVGVPLVNRLDAEAQRRRREARQEGRDESHAAYAADALVALTAGTGWGRSRNADVVFVCDVRAYRRGHAHPGEPVHIAGGGPVPVSTIREAVDDAFVKAVLHEGVDITTVAHYGRHRSAELRTALDLGRPPRFDGKKCAEPGCGRRKGLEDDHDNPLANGGATSYDNLSPRCQPHHRDKTSKERQAGLFDADTSDGDPP